MPTLNRTQKNMLVSFHLGVKVERPTGTLPATTDAALFAVSGRVALRLIVGEVTTVIQTVTTSNCKLKFNPTATGADTDLCAVLDISADAVGTMYTISGVAADAMRDRLLNGLGMASPVILSAGDLEIDMSTTNTGSVRWTVWYMPLDDGAVVTAV